MRDTGVVFWALPVARTIAGFILATMLGIGGGWIILIFNALLGYPWSMDLHRNLYYLGIGIGAGVGAYIGWANFAIHRGYIAAILLLTVAGGVVGAYLGIVYGAQADADLLGRGYTLEHSLHIGAPIGAILVSTVIGLVNEIRTGGR